MRGGAEYDHDYFTETAAYFSENQITLTVTLARCFDNSFDLRDCLLIVPTIS